MILSDEPGYYEAGSYGIRIENLVLVQKAAFPATTRSFLNFETLTLAPYDRRLIDLALLTPDEIAWIDAYLEKVRETLTPYLDAATAVWLANATRKIELR